MIRKRGHVLQYVERPPVASNVKPVVKLHAGEAAKQMTATTSSSSHVRFFGILSVMYLTCASGIAATIAVRTTAGATALHVMSPVSAYSFPMVLVRPITAAFDAE